MAGLSRVGGTGVTYALGVDVGTRCTVAAACAVDVVPPVAAPGPRVVLQTPTRAALREDGRLLVGSRARRGVEPGTWLGDVVGRVGDPVPHRSGPAEAPAQQVLAVLVDDAATRAEDVCGSRAAALAVTCPGSWGGWTRKLVAEALAGRDRGPVLLVPAPLAAAARADALARAAGTVPEPLRRLAVLDVGARGHEATLLTREEDHPWRAPAPALWSASAAAGDLDDVLLALVLRDAGVRLGPADLADPAVLAGLRRLRSSCADALRALGSAPEAVVPVELPADRDRVRLVRTEVEELLEPVLAPAVTTLERAVASGPAAGAAGDGPDAMLLVGGTAAVPLLAQLASAALGVPVLVEDDPGGTAATGAAVLASGSLAASGPADADAGGPADRDDDSAGSGDPPRAASADDPAATGLSRRRAVRLVLGAAAAVAVVGASAPQPGSRRPPPLPPAQGRGR